MIVNMLEGKVDPDKEDVLVETFKEALSDLPPAPTHAFLLRSSDPGIWRIVGVWRSQEEFDRYWSEMAPMKGLQTFRKVGVVPDMVVFDVVAHASN